MAAIRIPLNLFLTLLAAIGILEVLAQVPSISNPTGMLLFLGSIRVMEAALILLLVWRYQHRMSSIGLAADSFLTGLLQGLIWSAVFAAVVLIGFAVCLPFDINPFMWMRVRLPTGTAGIAAFYLVGGFIGPIAEEIFFRGLIFGFFRRWGFWPALAITTGFFVAAHFSGFRIPVTQLVGGWVFAMAYEKSGSLITPMVIHILGNLSIFTLALISGPG